MDWIVAKDGIEPPTWVRDALGTGALWWDGDWLRIKHALEPGKYHHLHDSAQIGDTIILDPQTHRISVAGQSVDD